MARNDWRKADFDAALAEPALAARGREALAAGRLCNDCLGRLFAQVGTGLANAERGRRVRARFGGPAPPEACDLCRGLFDETQGWAARVKAALSGLEFDTFAVASRTDPGLEAREAALTGAAGDETAEPYKQAFNRRVGAACCDLLDAAPDTVRPDVLAVCNHAAGTVEVEIRPLFLAGRYRKLVRGLPQCHWHAWPTSVQQIVGDPIAAEAGADAHVFHGCGREDTDVRCLGRRPFVLEVLRPERRRLDWRALEARIAADGRVEVEGLVPCARADAARVKALRPDKTYRALVHLEGDVPDEALAKLAALVGPIRQRTPERVLKRRADRFRTRRVRSLQWTRLGSRSLKLTIRTTAGLYIKELVGGDAGRTEPSVASVLETPATCVELDVRGVHVTTWP